MSTSNGNYSLLGMYDLRLSFEVAFRQTSVIYCLLSIDNAYNSDPRVKKFKEEEKKNKEEQKRIKEELQKQKEQEKEKVLI